MIVSHLLLILHKKIQFYIFMFEAWNVEKGCKVQGGQILLQGTVCMPLPNINMPCPLLSWLVITVLFHCRAYSPAQYALTNHVVPPPTYAMTSPGLNVSRDYISLIITLCLGLPPMYSLPTIPLSVHYAMNLSIVPRNLLLLLSVPNVLDSQFL